jgi:hypothetical protein
MSNFKEIAEMRVSGRSGSPRGASTECTHRQLREWGGYKELGRTIGTGTGASSSRERNRLGEVDSRKISRGLSMSAKSKRSGDNKPRKQQEPNLGQEEAEQQERSESELSHMGGASRSNTEDDKN